MKRLVMAVSVAIVSSVATVVPAEAAPPPETFNGLFGSVTATVNGSYTTINRTYEPHVSTDGILLYGPGGATDTFILDYGDDGSLDTVGGTINGTYRVGSHKDEGIIVFHAPGPTQDYLWIGSL